MQKKKLPRDPNSLAARIVAISTDEEPSGSNNPITPTAQKEKNAAAVALGRLGGLKGGKARAEKLSAKKRTEIARKAATKRWSAKKK